MQKGLFDEKFNFKNNTRGPFDEKLITITKFLYRSDNNKRIFPHLFG
jgi:hypothetical protein